jgi:hypothetical protein
MAGFAVVAAILTYAFVGVVGAVIFSLILFFLVRRKLRGEARSDRSLTIKAAAAPFLGLAWLVAALLIHVQVSNKLAHQDCGLSGDPYVTLPNGYELGSHNTYDGYIRAPGARTDVDVAGPGYVRSIVSLHLDNDVFTGTQFEFKTSSIRRFTLESRTQRYQSALVGPTSWEAANDQAQLGEDSYWKLYTKYRHHWPNYLLLALILGGEGAIWLWLRRAWREIPLEHSPTQQP